VNNPRFSYPTSSSMEPLRWISRVASMWLSFQLLLSLASCRGSTLFHATDSIYDYSRISDRRYKLMDKDSTQFRACSCLHCAKFKYPWQSCRQVPKRRSVASWHRRGEPFRHNNKVETRRVRLIYLESGTIYPKSLNLFVLQEVGLFWIFYEIHEHRHPSALDAAHFKELLYLFDLCLGIYLIKCREVTCLLYNLCYPGLF